MCSHRRFLVRTASFLVYLCHGVTPPSSGSSRVGANNDAQGTPSLRSGLKRTSIVRMVWDVYFIYMRDRLSV